jgi:hypothetical protein
VKHGSYVEQFGIELQFLPQPSQRAEIIDSGRMVEQKVGLGVSHEFGGGLRQFAVRDPDTCNGCFVHRGTVIAAPLKRYAIVPTN